MTTPIVPILISIAVRMITHDGVYTEKLEKTVRLVGAKVSDDINDFESRCVGGGARFGVI